MAYYLLMMLLVSVMSRSKSVEASTGSVSAHIATAFDCDLLYDDHGLSSEQRRICKDNLKLLQILITAGKRAIDVAQEFFQNSSINIEIPFKNYASFWIENGTKEAALVASLRSAFAVIEIASACDIHPGLCDCGPFVGRKIRQRGRYSMIWTGCVGAIKFASKYVEIWTTADRGPEDRDLKSAAEENSKLGRQIVEQLSTDPKLLHCQCRDEVGPLFRCCHGWCQNIPPTKNEVQEIVFALFRNESMETFDLSNKAFSLRSYPPA